MKYDDRKFFYRKDIHIADWLMSFKDKLTEEYLAYHTDYDTTFSKGTAIQNPHGIVYSNWKVDTLKNVFPEANVVYDPDSHPKSNIPVAFPTASHIARELGNNCVMLTYSTMEPHSFISRHADDQVDTKANQVRIHIPLIIPAGNIWLEIEGEEIDWTDIFAFNTLNVHSAYNRTDKRRLVLLLDVKRDFLNLLPASPFSREHADLKIKKSYIKHLPDEGITLTTRFNIDDDFNMIVEETPYIGEKNGNG